MTCRIFDYTLPDDVMAIKSFEIYYEFFGGAINMTIVSQTQQYFAGISSHDDNTWHDEIYKEEFEDDDPAKRAQTKGGYKDILANVKGGDSIQLWIETNGYAFAKNVKANISVYKKMSKELTESLVKPTNWVAQKATPIDISSKHNSVTPLNLDVTQGHLEVIVSNNEPPSKKDS